ncbi:hypothetical protein KMW28_20495 [Flammeovirga yaeyamensis]|uniref:DUF4440 domain-containing protein n=1 Tax=Flammeovirga yaeyamensis TaxID=367791 RepID=A0AAX1N374_9BACT|nr:uncharacterized protein [Flammeovirga yaeyamensis]NMF37670.1 hypothetical protein [Flammeovirga yaeyamensis]QWG01979.1 hypothetical protein KMW28_20495 [Flammeovirga yaeyamensis]
MALSIKTLKEIHQQDQFNWLRKYNALKTKFQNLESAYQVSFQANQKIENLIIKDTIIHIGVDTLETYKTIQYQDEYLALEVLLDSSRNATVEYKVDVPIEVVAYWERKWFLGKKKWKCEVVNGNENVRVEEVLSISIK